jgi:hypothetical protein
MPLLFRGGAKNLKGGAHLPLLLSKSGHGITILNVGKV